MKRQLTFFILGLFLIGLVSAIPSPHGFNGKVYYSDGATLLKDGYSVTAKIGGVEKGSSNIVSGSYDLVVESSSGGNIYFYVNSEAVGSRVFKNFEVTELNFTTSINNPAPPANNPPGGSSPGGGSPGGGGSPSSNDGTIHVISTTQISSGITKDMGVKDQMKFQIENAQHTLSLNYVDGTSASITVQSNPLTFVLEIGQEKKIDFELDGFYDLVVKLEEIVNNKATINIQSINEEVIEESEDDILDDTESEDSQNFFGTMTGAVIGNLKTKGGIATVFVLVVVIGGALAIFITRKKKLQKIK